MPHGWSRSLAGVVRNGLRVEPALFDVEADAASARELFARFVEQIEVETTSFCNRTCSFCPNAFIDRRSEAHPMPADAWEAILAGLAEVRYEGTFVWSRYSEPLSERGILERIRQVRAAAPRCRISLNTNGDYLDGPYFADLCASGIDRVMVDLYMHDDAPDTVEYSRGVHERFLARIERGGRVEIERPEMVGRVEAPIEVVTRVRNGRTMARVHVSDRGGLLTIGAKRQRTSPCFLPFKQLVIDWDGSIVPCCQIRSDAAAHAPAVVGRLGSNLGLVAGYMRLGAWRRALAAYGPKVGPCATCNYAESGDARSLRWAAHLALDGPAWARSAARAVLGPWLEARRTW
jgi:hypothetical protein